MITEEDAFELLKKHKLPEGIIEHSKGVLKTSIIIIKRLKKNGVKVDEKKTRIAAILHDIGRVHTLRDGPTPEFGDRRHERHSVDILKKEGLPEIAEIVAKHGYFFFDHKSENLTIEEKILILADLTTKEGKNVSLQERKEYVVNKYLAAKDNNTAERFDKNWHQIEELEKEIEAMIK